MISLTHESSYGRLGNKLLQNVGISVLSKKYDLFPQYNNLDENDILKLKLNMGSIKYEREKIYTDNDLGYLLNSTTKIDHAIRYHGFFQSKELLFDNKDLIDDVIPKIEVKHKNKVFVHVRLGDVKCVNMGLEYYRRILNSISFVGGLISSDSSEDSLVNDLSVEYNLEIFNSSPIDTILTGSQYEHRVLSGGTFSWWIGFLGNNNNVYCNKKPLFHGDIFVYPEWKYFDI